MRFENRSRHKHGSLAAIDSMDVVRQIDVFDNKTELLVQEIAMDVFDLDTFKTRFNAKKEDPLMYDPYEITEETVDLFPDIKFDFKRFSYYVGCYQA
jgi:hypothetical protein